MTDTAHARHMRQVGTVFVPIEASVPDPVPRQFFFRDIDGNRFLVVQPD